MERLYIIDTLNVQMNFEFDFKDKSLVAQLKQISFDTRFNYELDIYIVPVNDWTRTKLLNFVKLNKFVAKPVVKVDYGKFDYSTPDLEKLREEINSLNLTYSARDYQIESLAYALQKGSFINADPVGCGKSFEAIINVEHTKAFPCLVVVPASIKYAWVEKWLEIVGEHRIVSSIESTPTKKNPNNWNADVVVINYDIIGKKQGTGATVKFEELVTTKWKSMVIDEGHYLKSESSQRNKAARMIVKKTNPVVQILTGTAITNRPAELWPLLKIIGKSDLIANHQRQYEMRYCNGFQSNFGWNASGATNLLELNQKLRETCYLRREKSELLKELPPVQETILHVPITNKKEVDKATENIIEYIMEVKGEEAAEKAMNAESLVTLSTLRQLSIQGKIKAIEAYIKDWQGDKDEKLVIFGLHKEPLEYLAEKFNSKLIAGGVSSLKKQQIIDDWIKGKDQFLFANIASAGTGVDGLQSVCSNMAIIELPWTSGELEQVVGRLNRSGQTENTNVTFILSEDTIDTQMWEMLSNKQLVVNGVNAGDQSSNMKMVFEMMKSKKKK